MTKIDFWLNDFAVRCFRDIADGDYITARMACRAELPAQYLWASQQAVEKYIKCILLLNRIPGKNVLHGLGKGLSIINASGKVTLALKEGTKEFIDYLDTFGKYRYLEVSNYAFGHYMVPLDRAVWELRRFCTLDREPAQAVLRDGFPAPKVRLSDGRLEKIIDSPKDPARESLLWQNAFFGNRNRRQVKLRPWYKASTSPLLHSHILDEVLKYVYLPKELVARYRAAKKNP